MCVRESLCVCLRESVCLIESVRLCCERVCVFERV